MRLSTMRRSDRPGNCAERHVNLDASGKRQSAPCLLLARAISSVRCRNSPSRANCPMEWHLPAWMLFRGARRSIGSLIPDRSRNVPVRQVFARAVAARKSQGVHSSNPLCPDSWAVHPFAVVRSRQRKLCTLQPSWDIWRTTKSDAEAEAGAAWATSGVLRVMERGAAAATLARDVCEGRRGIEGAGCDSLVGRWP
jgi:hypothetical protein